MGAASTKAWAASCTRASGRAFRRSPSSPSRRRARSRADGRRQRHFGDRSMAMNVGSGGGGSDMDVMIDINTTPLIAVMLGLIVMLIITIPIQLHSVNLNMPTGNPPPPLVLPEVVKLDIDDQSRVYWNGEVVDDRTTLESKMSESAQEQVQPEVHLRPDKQAKYSVVAGVMASAQRLGLTKIGIVGSEQFIE